MITKFEARNSISPLIWYYLSVNAIYDGDFCVNNINTVVIVNVIIYAFHLTSSHC